MGTVTVDQLFVAAASLLGCGTPSGLGCWLYVDCGDTYNRSDLGFMMYPAKDLTETGLLLDTSGIVYQIRFESPTIPVCDSPIVYPRVQLANLFRAFVSFDDTALVIDYSIPGDSASTSTRDFLTADGPTLRLKFNAESQLSRLEISSCKDFER